MGYWDDKHVEFSSIVGTVFSKIEQVGDEEIHFYTAEGRHLKMHHEQSCCESVNIESIAGDLQDLVGTPILLAEEASSEERPSDVPAGEVEEDNWYDDSETWTFYKLATIKGYVDIRWYGTSNGYYSESVDFVEMP